MLNSNVEAKNTKTGAKVRLFKSKITKGWQKRRVTNNVPKSLKKLALFRTSNDSPKLPVDLTTDKDKRGSFLKRTKADYNRLIKHETYLRVFHWTSVGLGTAATALHVSFPSFMHDASLYTLSYSWLAASLVPGTSLLWNTHPASHSQPIAIEADLIKESKANPFSTEQHVK